MDGSNRLTDRNRQFLKFFQPPSLTLAPARPTLPSSILPSPALPLSTSSDLAVRCHRQQFIEEPRLNWRHTSPPDGERANVRNEDITSQNLDPVAVPPPSANNGSGNHSTANSVPKPSLPVRRLHDFNSPGLKETDNANSTTRVRRPPDRFGHT